MTEKTYKQEWDEQFDKFKKAFSIPAMNFGGDEMKNKPIFKQPSKEEIRDKHIEVMDIDLKFLWDKAMVNEKKIEQVNEKIARVDKGVSNVFEKACLNRKDLIDLQARIRSIENKIERKKVEKYRKQVKTAEIISAILGIVIIGLTIIGAVTLASWL